jgi:methylenetetrahydrofolate dehydrogenase (NADP+)/methenyltetrahydrofolate cyclohydrolase
MPATLIDGEALAARVRDAFAADVALVKRRTGKPPRLAAVLVGDDAGPRVYARSQAAACEAAGLAHETVALAADASDAAVASRINLLAADPDVHGILLQMPLPHGLNARTLAEHIPPAKDVEGVTSANLGRLMFYEEASLVPCTAAAALELICFAGVQLRGAECVVVGHSPIVGKPLACLLTNALATCTICHVGTRDLATHTRRAEVLVVAAGKPGLITGGHIRPGATVIDVGINRVPVLDEAGRRDVSPSGKPRMKTVGDVDFDSAVRTAGAITPVPGGVGPVTVAMLLRNTVRAAMAQTA